MHAADIMTPDVITVTPSTPLSGLVQLMLDRDIGGVPVMEKHRIVGIVTEGDLLRRKEMGTERQHNRWLSLLGFGGRQAADYIKTHGRRAGEIMTSPVITVTDSTSISDVAVVLESRGIKRVPVLRDGNLVGIISRRNLVQALACQLDATPDLDDRRIRNALLAELHSQPWAPSPTEATVIVQDRVVHFWGFVRSETKRKAMAVAAENIPGVLRVDDHMEAWTSGNGEGPGQTTRRSQQVLAPMVIAP
jgi:CBS domain-containing protein